MDPFSYLSVLISIILALGMTRVLAGVGESGQVRGQAIFVDPASRLVMVHTAVRKQAIDPGNREAVALWQSLVRELGTDQRSVTK